MCPGLGRVESAFVARSRNPPHWSMRGDQAWIALAASCRAHDRNRVLDSGPARNGQHQERLVEGRVRRCERRLGPQPSWSALENIGPILWEHGGDLEPFVLHAFEKHRLREQRIRHDGLRLRSLVAVYAAIATGRHAGYVTERLAEGLTDGNPGLRPIPAYDILIRYWFFGPHQGLGQLLSEAIKSEAVKPARSPIKEESNGRESQDHG